MENKIKRVKKINVLLCIGTRPEGIKLAPIIKSLGNKKDKFVFKVCSTGQHDEMLKQVFNFFEINPDIDLNLMTTNQTLGSLSFRVMDKIDKVMDIINPDIILIQGDTTTAFLSALSAYYKKIKIGHVEAGLRTYDKYNPFPEEINRQLISRIADFNFVPTRKSFDNLLNENINKNTIFLTGNTIVDAVNWAIEKIKKDKGKIEQREPFKTLDSKKKIILVTMHRRESFGEGISNVCNALKKIAIKYDYIQIVYPVHLNPNVKKPVYKILGKLKNILLTNPLDYESFIWLMNKSYFIITDSGGVQEEAPTLKKPVLVIRKKTERTESIDLGISKLIGTNEKDIIESVSNLIENKSNHDEMIPGTNPYGDGKASERIVDFILGRKYERFNY